LTRGWSEAKVEVDGVNRVDIVDIVHKVDMVDKVEYRKQLAPLYWRGSGGGRKS
jgi:hypothetical protein